MKKYIILAGNIGAGKSTLVKEISIRLNWKPYYEPVTENPYLEDFYSDMERWAFHSQMYFLTDRDYETYREMYCVMVSFLQPPDLVVYLRTSLETLKKRIAFRGRGFEAVIPRIIDALRGDQGELFDYGK